MSQKVIKIGSSIGVTLPKRLLEKLALEPGDSVDLLYNPRKEVVELAKAKEEPTDNHQYNEITKIYLKYKSQLDSLEQ